MSESEALSRKDEAPVESPAGGIGYRAAMAGRPVEEEVSSEREVKAALDVAAKAAEAARPRQVAKGGVYVPPHKLKQLYSGVTDKKSAIWQRIQWDALRKSINGLINKVNTSNIKNIIPELFHENLIRGRGLFCRSVMKAQMASPNFTHVYAALVAVINTKIPEIGELILRRYMAQFRRAYRRNDKIVSMSCTRFLAHATNQQFAHELIALQLLALLLEKPTDDSVEVAVDFIKECGQQLQSLAPRAAHGVFERFRAILHEGEIDRRVQYIIEGLFAVRKGGFADYQAVLPELDLVELDDQITHEIALDEDHDIQKELDVFHFDPDWEENEKQYIEIRKEILGDDDEEPEKKKTDSDEDEDTDSEDEAPAQPAGVPVDDLSQMQDRTEADTINLRRTIYLTIMSSLSFEECAHKLMKMSQEPDARSDLHVEIANMVIECCSQERSYIRFYGSLGERFCQVSKEFQDEFEDLFAIHYATIHRFETNRLRNIAKFFGHLLYTDALDWHVLSYIRLNEEETTSASRIFIKILFRELVELMGLIKLRERLQSPSLQDALLGIFPRDHPKNTRFSINFFTSIGLGGLTEELRTFLKNAPKMLMQQQHAGLESDSDSDSSSSSSSSDSDSDSSSDSSSSDSSSSDSDSSSSSSSSDSEDDRRSKRRSGRRSRDSRRSRDTSRRGDDRRDRRDDSRARRSVRDERREERRERDEKRRSRDNRSHRDSRDSRKEDSRDTRRDDREKRRRSASSSVDAHKRRRRSPSYSRSRSRS